MPDLFRRLKAFTLGNKLLGGLLGLFLFLPTFALGGDPILRVPPPNGVDDTFAIQRTLDAAVASGRSTTVELAAGKYLSRQLLTFNFRGTFKGAGKDRTTIEALPNQVSDSPDICEGFRLLDAHARSWRWPSFILFVDGDIAVSDLSIRITATSGTAIRYQMCGYDCRVWLDGLKFTGQHPMNVRLDRIALEGRPDLDPQGLDFGYNVVNGVSFGGDLLRDTPEIQYLPLSGTFAMRNCEIRSVAAGLCNYFFFKDARVVVGGSPSAGNVFEDVRNGLDLETAENAHFEVSYNRSTGSQCGMWICQYYGDLFVPARPSQFFIHDNHFTSTGTGPGTQGIYLMNGPDQPWIQARIFNNRIETPNHAGEGIGIYNVRGAFLANNTILGGGASAIGLWNTSLCALLGNHMRGFSAFPAQICLDPDSDHNLVVCANPLDTVQDQGTDNRIISGSLQPASSPLKAAPAGRAILHGRRLPFR